MASLQYNSWSHEPVCNNNNLNNNRTDDRLIGSGTYSNVYSRYDHNRKMYIAVKSARRRESNGIDETFLMEMQCLSILKGHPNICQLLDVDIRLGINGPYTSLMLELYDLSLANYIKLLRTTDQKIKVVELVSSDIGSALASIHRHNIIHRDLSVSNILVKCRENSINFSLADFGFAAITSSTGGTSSTSAYADSYRAPELEVGSIKSYDSSADVYAFGMCLRKTKGHRVKITINDLPRTFDLKTYLVNNSFKDSIPDHIMSSITQLLMTQPSDRPKMTEKDRLFITPHASNISNREPIDWIQKKYFSLLFDYVEFCRDAKICKSVQETTISLFYRYMNKLSSAGLYADIDKASIILFSCLAIVSKLIGDFSVSYEDMTIGWRYPISRRVFHTTEKEILEDMNYAPI